MPKNKKIISLPSSVKIPEHPAGRAYIEQFNAKADAMSDEEATRKYNKIRASDGLPPLTVEQMFGGRK
jgi:hypothetical protein